ncbi:MAG: hypothetical protein HY774_28310 [Acidobacteria bacterium]|nr:hypothetical protein [Acidobacteriota bacterium]
MNDVDLAYPPCRLVIELDQNHKSNLTIVIEPWGESYQLQAADKLEIFPQGNGYFHQVIAGETLFVYFEAGYDYPQLVKNGVDVTGQCS